MAEMDLRQQFLSSDGYRFDRARRGLLFSYQEILCRNYARIGEDLRQMEYFSSESDAREIAFTAVQNFINYNLTSFMLVGHCRKMTKNKRYRTSDLWREYEEKGSP